MARSHAPAESHCEAELPCDSQTFQCRQDWIAEGEHILEHLTGLSGVSTHRQSCQCRTRYHTRKLLFQRFADGTRPVFKYEVDCPYSLGLANTIHGRFAVPAAAGFQEDREG